MSSLVRLRIGRHSCRGGQPYILVTTQNFADQIQVPQIISGNIVMIDLDLERERERVHVWQVSSVKMALQAHFYRQHLDRHVTCKESVGPHNRA